MRIQCDIVNFKHVPRRLRSELLISDMKHTKMLIAVKGHESKYPNPIKFAAGEQLIVGEKDSEFEDWIWVTTADGNQGWAPIPYLTIDRNRAVAIQDYTAVELNTTVGEQLTLQYELCGWGWVEKSDGSCGWIPLTTTEQA